MAKSLTDNDKIVKTRVSLAPPTIAESSALALPVVQDITTALEDLGEDKEKWWNPAQNAKGFSDDVHFHVPPELHALMGEIIAARRFPYKRAADLIRHAVMRHLAFLSSKMPSSSKSHYAKVLVLQEYLEQQQRNQDFFGIITGMEKFIQEALTRNDRGAAIELVEGMKERVRDMEPMSWRIRYIREIARISKALLGDGKK